ncbi:MAG: hypothetical protein II896_05810 [Clostridia bacterium]|nr:hypothetical protein [Clostridia bacterium]
MKRKIRSSLVIAIACLIVGVTIIIVNYALDNTGGRGYSSSMSTLGDYRRSLVMVISAISLSAAAVVMMVMSLITFMKRRQAEDEELLRRLDEEERAAAKEESDDA